MTAALLLLALVGPASAEVTIHESVALRIGKGKRVLVQHSFDDADDGAIHLAPDGRYTWVLTLQRQAYEDRVETCVSVVRRHKRGGVEDIARPCVAVAGLQSPQASTEQTAGPYGVKLSVERRAE